MAELSVTATSLRDCAVCGKRSRPLALMPNIAQALVGRPLTASALRIIRFPQFPQLPLRITVTFEMLSRSRRPPSARPSRFRLRKLREPHHP